MESNWVNEVMEQLEIRLTSHQITRPQIGKKLETDLQVMCKFHVAILS